MQVKEPKTWKCPVNDVAFINFGPVQLYCYPDPSGRGFRFKVGSRVSDKVYSSLEGAQYAGLRLLEKLGEAIVEGVRSMPEYETNVKPVDKSEQLDAWHISILGVDNGRG